MNRSPVRLLIILGFTLGFAANLQAVTLMWDAPAPQEPPIDGYKLYCTPEPTPDLSAVAPIYTGIETQVLLDDLIPFDILTRCWAITYRGDLQSAHSNHLVFTPTTSETIILPTAPGSLTIRWAD